MKNIYEVGGAVRDSILGIKSKDIDYVYVAGNVNTPIVDAYTEMRESLLSHGYTIFLETPGMVTIRAKFPAGHQHEKLVADFVLARKEVGYSLDSRKPKVVVGSLNDDLLRRDFTVNAIARDLEGRYIDPLNGISAIANRELTCPGLPMDSLMDDPLRLLRAIRFKVTKSFTLSQELFTAIHTLPFAFYRKFVDTVSEERVREELNKSFEFNTLETVTELAEIDKASSGKLFTALFSKNLRLEATLKPGKQK